MPDGFAYDAQTRRVVVAASALRGAPHTQPPRPSPSTSSAAAATGAAPGAGARKPLEPRARRPFKSGGAGTAKESGRKGVRGEDKQGKGEGGESKQGKGEGGQSKQGKGGGGEGGLPQPSGPRGVASNKSSSSHKGGSRSERSLPASQPHKDRPSSVGGGGSRGGREGAAQEGAPAAGDEQGGVGGPRQLPHPKRGCSSSQQASTGEGSAVTRPPRLCSTVMVAPPATGLSSGMVPPPAVTMESSHRPPRAGEAGLAGGRGCLPRKAALKREGAGYARSGSPCSVCTAPWHVMGHRCSWHVVQVMVVAATSISLTIIIIIINIIIIIIIIILLLSLLLAAISGAGAPFPVGLVVVGGANARAMQWVLLS